MEIIELVFGFILAFMIAYFGYNVSCSVANLILGPILGYKISSISFFGLMLARQKGKLRFKGTRLTFVLRVMLEVNANKYWKKLLLELGNIVAGLGVIYAYYAIFMPKVNESWVGVLEKAAWVLAAFLVLHTITWFGLISKMYGKGPKAVIWRETERVKTLILQGTRPGDIQFMDEDFGIECFGEDVSHRNYDMYRYYNALDSGDWEKVSELAYRMEAMLPNTWDNSQIPYFYELVYYWSAVAGNVNKAESLSNIISEIMDKDEDANGKRVYAAYLYYTGKDRKIALDVARQGIKVLDECPNSGLDIMERELLNQMIKEIEGDIEWNFQV